MKLIFSGIWSKLWRASRHIGNHTRHDVWQCCWIFPAHYLITTGQFSCAAALQRTSIKPFRLSSRLPMESLNLNTLAHSLPNANNLANSEKDLLNNFKGRSYPTIFYHPHHSENIGKLTRFTFHFLCSGCSEYNNPLSLIPSNFQTSL
jgi:hypothetical protein